MDDDRVVEFDDGDDDLPFALNERVDEEETHPRPAPPSASSSHHDHDSASSSAFRSFGSSSVTPERKKTARLRTGTTESEVTAPITPASASASASLLYLSQGPPSSSTSSYGVAVAAAAAGGLHLAPFDGSAATPSQSSVPSAHHQTSSSSTTYNPVNDQRYLSPSHRCSIHLDESGGGGPLSPSAAEAACAAAALLPSDSVSIPLGPLAVSLAATSVSTADFQQDASSSHLCSPHYHPALSTSLIGAEGHRSKMVEEKGLAIVEEGQTIVEEGQAAMFEEEEEVTATEDEEAVQYIENGEGDGGGGMIICGPSSQSFATVGRATGRAPVADDRRDMHRIAEAARRRMLSSGLRDDRGAASGISVAGMETVLMQSTQQRHHPSNLPPAAGGGGRPAIEESVGFSQLMRRAEEGGGGSVAANQGSWVLHAPSSSFPEGTTTSTTREGTISPSAGDRFRLLPRGGAARSGGVGFPLSPPPTTTASTNAADAAAASSSAQGSQAVPQHLASEPPASVVERLDSVCFRVRTSIALPAASKPDVVDLLSDPESLGRWFGPVLGRAVYVTRSDHRGGGGASATSSASASSPSEASHESERSTGNRDREYDGEWIEASSAGGLRPPSGLDNDSADYGDGCARRAWIRTKSFLGFPTYGKLSMFVERNAGRVGMTVGPYDSKGTAVSHSFEVTLEEEGEGAASSPSVTVTDTVRMDRSPDYDAGGGYSWTCNLCRGPGPAEHAAQAAVSLDRLRRLIEGGGGGGGAGSDFSLAHGDPSSLAATIIPESGDGGDWDGAARVPLLPGP